MNAYVYIKLVLIAVVGMFFPAVFAESAETAVEQTHPDRTPRMNVVFLDDGAVRLDSTQPVRRNDWQEWKDRVATFLGLLHKFVAEFQEATEDVVSKSDSLFALEVAATLPSERKDDLIAGELQRIFQATGRPSSILARSTAGEDQLRLVFQDGKDYRPIHAAKFLRKFAEISPVIAHSGIASHFGPFQPPPTMVFDPCETAVLPRKSGPTNSRHRWGLVEDESYLLPHYVLHALCVLNEATAMDERTFYQESTPEAGTLQVADVRFNITDFGINQWKPGLRTGDDFSQASNKLFSQIPKNGQILIVQPDDRQFRQKTTAQLANDISKTIEPLVKQALTAGIRDFDLQVVQHINSLGYFDPNRQAGVDKFGQAAYQGIGNVIQKVKDEGYTTDARAFTFSNGTKVFANNVDTWKPYVQSALFGDGRASKTSMSGVIDQLGGKNVTFINTRGDWPAPNSIPFIKDSIGNLDTVKALKQQHPDVKALWLHSSGDPWFGTGHVDSTKPGKLFAVKELTEKGFSPLGSITGGDIMSMSGGPKSSSLPEPGGILFDKKSIYSLDVSGGVQSEARLAADAVRRSDGAFVVEGKQRVAAGFRIPGAGRKSSPKGTGPDSIPRLSGCLFLVCLDLSDCRNGSLPLSVPRFLSPEAMRDQSLGGAWTFEPLRAYGLERLAAPAGKEILTDIIVIPGEAYGQLSYSGYRPASAGELSDDQPLSQETTIDFISKKGRLQPELAPTSDGKFALTLRHGVSIAFDERGLVQSIREPDGDSVDYVRDQKDRLIGQESSDGRRIQIEYESGRPSL